MGPQTKSLKKNADSLKKSHECNQCDYASSHTGHLRTHLKTHNGEKSNKCNQCDFASSNLKTHTDINHMNASNATMHLLGQAIEEAFENAQWRKVKQMQPMRLCICSGMQFEDTSENAQWKKIKQMQPM